MGQFPAFPIASNAIRFDAAESALAAHRLPAITPRLVPPNEVGFELGLAAVTVRRKLRTGDLPGCVILGPGPKAPVRMRRAELDRLIGERG